MIFVTKIGLMMGFKRIIVASGICYGHKEPHLSVTTCEECKTRLQVSKNPVTGELRAEKMRGS